MLHCVLQNEGDKLHSEFYQHIPSHQLLQQSFSIAPVLTLDFATFLCLTIKISTKRVC